MKFILGLGELPFEQLHTQIIYTEGQYDPAVNQFILENYQRICQYCNKQGYEFCYMPKLTEEVRGADAIFYNAPYAKTKVHPRKIGNDFLLQYMSRPENKEEVPPSLLYMMPDDYYYDDEKEGSVNLCTAYTLESGPNETFYETFFRILGRIINSVNNSREDIDQRRSISFYGDDSKPRQSKKESPAFERLGKWFEDIAFDVVEGSVAEETQDELYEVDCLFDKESAMIANEIYERVKTLEKKGISRYVLNQYITGKEKLSRLHITADYRILLPDYGELEIEMTPLPKAIYFLFLRHPEGIPFKCLPDYRQELMEIYNRLKPSSESSASLRSIETVISQTGNSINEKCSRIREAFISKFEEHLAQNYFITGKRGEAKGIKLPRKLVTWDDSLS